MTILCTYKTDDKIYLACDTQSTKEVKKYTNTKWHKLNINENSKCWIGVTGYTKYSDFFEYAFQPPTFHEDTTLFAEYLHKELAPSLTEALTERKIVKETDNTLNSESEFIIVYDEVYSLVDDAAPVQVHDEFYAAGSGCRLAYGAYHACSDVNDAVLLMKLCVDAAVTYDIYCGGETKVYCVPRL